MNDSKISVRYAKALFQAAKELRKLKEVSKDMALLNSSLELPEFGRILESPVIKSSEKTDLIQKVFAKSIDTLSMDFLLLILKNKRENHIPGMIRNYTRLFKDEQGIKTAELIVPSEVTKAHKEKFKEILAKVYNSKIEFKDKINPDLIGGFILKVEDEQFDASVSTSLSKIEKNLLETSIETNIK